MTGNISKFIKDQFPAFYHDGGEDFVAFMEAYYEFVESRDDYMKMSRDAININDIDNSPAAFVANFKAKYLADVPYISSVDKRFMVKHIMDYYKSKGSEKSIKLLLRLLLGQETDVYYPGSDVLRASDSKWVKPVYLELTQKEKTKSFINTQIMGSRSKATAFVESIVTKRIEGKLIDVVYISDVRGTFVANEVVTNDGILKGAPKVIGSLSRVSIVQGGRNNRIGDIFTVESPGGKQGKVRVSKTVDATGRVDFKINDGGYGYYVGGSSDVKVSSAVLLANNSDLKFIRGETLTQSADVARVYSANALLSAIAPGTEVKGRNGSGAVVATGNIVTSANTDGDWNTISTASANGILTIYPTSGSFAAESRITTSATQKFRVGEGVKQESEVMLDVTVTSGSISIGQTLSQNVYENFLLPVSNTTIQSLVSSATGKITAYANGSVTLSEVFGDFTTGPFTTASGAGDIASVTVIAEGPHAIIKSVTNTTSFIIDNADGDFVIGKKIKGRGAAIRTISAFADVGVTDIQLSSNASVNAIVDFSKTRVNSFQVVGQNTSAFGIHGNTYPVFPVVEGATFPVKTQRYKMVSPPKDANGSVIEYTVSYSGVSTGKGAGFSVGDIENEETVTLNTDFFSGLNAYGEPYMEIQLDGKGSGVGFVDSVNVVAGGSGYANGDVITFPNGGYGDGEPTVTASGVITTWANGAIKTVTVTNHGQGYYGEPDVSLTGTGVVEPVMSYGYGFPKSVAGGFNTIMEQMLNIDTFTIGKISALGRINPGSNYNMNPFVLVDNPLVSSFGRRNFYIYMKDVGGAFATGERVSQTVDGITSVKGEVISMSGNVILVKRTSFNTAFSFDVPIVGVETGSQGTIVSVVDDPESEAIGINADISGNVISANGIVTEVEVIDSGYGYVNDVGATLTRDGSVFIVTGVNESKTQGKGEGYWVSTNSHLNSEKKLHDNKYYQEFSYDVRCWLSLDKYKAIAERLVHVAGTKMFGTVVKTSVIKRDLKQVETEITLSS